MWKQLKRIFAADVLLWGINIYDTHQVGATMDILYSREVSHLSGGPDMQKKKVVREIIKGDQLSIGQFSCVTLQMSGLVLAPVRGMFYTHST